MKKSLIFLLFTFSVNCYSQINDGLVAFYSFCGNANDESNNSNDATIFGATLVADRFGNSERAYLFDGIDDFMEIENSQNIENLSSQISISVWFNTNNYYSTANNWAILLTKSGNSTSDNSRQFSLYYREDGDILFNSNIIGNFLFDLDIWYNLTVTYDFGNVNTYVNGVLINNVNGINPVLSNQLSLMLGYDSPGVPEYYDGILDEIRIYNRILSENEITQLANNDLGCTILNIDGSESKLLDFIIYPNPSKEKLLISSNLKNQKEIECYDINGKLIFKNTFNEPSIEIITSNLKSGIYIIKLSSQSGIYYQKLVKE